MSPVEPLPSTRERILAYLSEHATVTAAQLSHAWGLTRPDIRYHLQGLLADGLVESLPRASQPVTNQIRPTGRGRPEQHYRLANPGRPGNYAQLSAILLAHIFTDLPNDNRQQATQAIAHSLCAGFIPPAAITQRYTQAVEYLNQQGYHARWEASALGPRFLLRACPYAALLPDHPYLCQIDQAVLETLTGARLRLSTRMDPLTGRPPACVFLRA